jgi:hypothetical protein
MVLLKTIRFPEAKPSKWLKAYLAYDAIAGEYSLLGIERQE